MTHTSTEQPEALSKERIENVIFRMQQEGDIQAAQTVKALHARVQELEASQARVPLSDEVIRELYSEESHWDMVAPYVIAFVRSIESFHGITQEKQG